MKRNKLQHIILLTALMISGAGSLMAQTATSDAPVKIHKAKNGTIILGEGATVRALDPCGTNKTAREAYIAVVNKYKETFPFANVYFMPIPTASAFYLPEEYKSWSIDQNDVINKMIALLDGGAKGINLYPALNAHKDEAIYSRTDHHWQPLGAYYAAQALAKTAGVPFMDLTHYDEKVVHNYVGSMYRFTGESALKNAPEDFIWWEPKGVDYTCRQVLYTVSKSGAVLKQSPLKETEFFHHFPDGSGGAYCTFMGGDSNNTQVTTSTKNGRRVLIFKDSFGNALGGYLFFSFEEVHVIDCRYFPGSIKDYVIDHDITDIVFANNLGHANVMKIARYYENFLNK